MGQSLSHLYFDRETGRPHLRVITLSTMVFACLYLNAFTCSITMVKDDSMHPVLRKAGYPFSDSVLYRKFMSPQEKMKDRIVAVRDPARLDSIVFRRVIAEENQWVQRSIDGGLIKIPKGHVWIEQENDEVQRSVDSLADEIGGPVSMKLVLGPAYRIVWPIWRAGKFSDIDKFRRLLPQDRNQVHSRVYTNEEIFRKYGIK